ncbi:MAG: hypothetical protein E7045_08890 [Lentisphaerae bacterium]|nr:hypothetical protein [Lentisphaerota bacterium]
MEKSKCSRKAKPPRISKFVLLFLLFIPWGIMTLADPVYADKFDNISNILMIKSLYGIIIIYLVQIITIFSIDNSMRCTVWEKLYVKENFAVFVICFTESLFMWSFVVIRQAICTIILPAFSLSEAISGWVISLILLSPFIYLMRRWL